MSTEFADTVKLDRVRYSQTWEDCSLAARGLAVGRGDDVLSVGSAGCNVLALLLEEPRRVTALDVNPAQTALLELKLAAIGCLDYEEYVELIGARESSRRAAWYDRVRLRLSAAARAFWDERSDCIQSGVIDCGKLDAYFQMFRSTLRTLHDPATVDELLQQDEPAEQAACFSRFATPELEVAFKVHYGRESMQSYGRDPAQFRYAGDIDVGTYFWERFRFACTQLPTRGNFYLEYFLTGRYRDLEQGPSHLRRACFERLRLLVDRVEVVTEELSRFLEQRPAGIFNKVNLSNVVEYMSPEAAQAFFDLIGRRVRRGGRTCYWNFLVPRSSAMVLRPLSEALSRQDRSWVYRAFYVDEVR